MTRRPLIGISTGDPAGIGPEVTLKALSLRNIYDIYRPLVVCDSRVMEAAAQFCMLPLKMRNVASPAEGCYEHGVVDVLDMRNVDLDQLEYKKVAAMTGKASFEYIKKVIELAPAKGGLRAGSRCGEDGSRARRGHEIDNETRELRLASVGVAAGGDGAARRPCRSSANSPVEIGETF